jgi:Fic family protein
MLNLEKIFIAPHIVQLIGEVDEFKGAWTALEEHTTALQLLGDVATFGRNFREILEPWQSKPIDEELIKKLHAIVMGVKQESNYKNAQMPLVIQRGEQIFGTLDVADASEAPEITAKLIDWAGEALERKRFHPLIVIALFTVIFLQTAPFEKGNQRLVRLLITLLMFRCGYAYAPYSLLDQLLEDRISDYYDVLQYTQSRLQDGDPDWEPWILFFLMLLMDKTGVLKARLSTKAEDLGEMPQLSLKVLKLFETHDRMSMKEIERLTRGKRSTLKLRLKELVEQGYLMRHGQARSTWYSRI